MSTRHRSRGRASALMLSLLLVTGPATAQAIPEPRFSRTRAVHDVYPVPEIRLTGTLLHHDPPRAGKSPWFAPLASLVVPGSGQALLGQQRSVGYLVAEGFLIIRAVRAQRDANEARSGAYGYRTLAADVARAPFSADRPTGPWEYYETLEYFTESGAYDLGLGGRFTPETDESTYNGRQWLQARETFWARADRPPPETSEEYQRAVAFYTSRAVRGNFQWSWRENLFVQSQYIAAIRDSNRSEQHLVSTLGLVATNHLVSLVDAYITVRLRRYGGAGLVGAMVRTEVRPVATSPDAPVAASIRMSIPFGGRAER